MKHFLLKALKDKGVFPNHCPFVGLKGTKQNCIRDIFFVVWSKLILSVCRLTLKILLFITYSLF